MPSSYNQIHLPINPRKKKIDKKKVSRSFFLFKYYSIFQQSSGHSLQRDSIDTLSKQTDRIRSSVDDNSNIQIIADLKTSVMKGHPIKLLSFAIEDMSKLVKTIDSPVVWMNRAKGQNGGTSTSWKKNFFDEISQLQEGGIQPRFHMIAL